ncbi:MAG TPA: MFS transporter [Chitinophagales bacterium]|nr:MFS transporter [Chitinophagales bacterium]
MIRKATTYYLNTYKGLSKEIWLLAFVNLVNRCGTMVGAFLMIYLTSQIGCTLTQAGSVLALFGIGAIFGSLAGGKLTDKIGFYKVQLVTLVLGGLIFIVLGQLRTYYSICICIFILGFVNEAFRPANSAALAKYSDEKNRMRSFSLMRLAFNLGWAVGGGIGGLLASYSYQYLFWIDGLTNIAAAGLIYLLLPPQIIENAKEKAEAILVKTSVYKDKVFISFALVSLLFIMSFFQMLSNLTTFFKTEVHLSERFIGLLMMWNGILIVLIEMTLVYYLEKNWSKRKAVIFGVSLHVIAYLCLLIFKVNFVVAFVSMTFITLSEIFAFSVLVSFWMSRANENNRGQYAGIWTMTWAIAQSTGSFLGAAVAQYFGFNILWCIVIVFCTAAIFFYSRLIKN